MLQNKTHGVGGIMRHGEGMNVEVPELKGGSACEEAPFRIDVASAEAVRRQLVCENRDRFFSAKSFEPARVVHMLVGEQNPCETLRGGIQSDKKRAKAFRAEARVDQNRGPFRLGKNSVSRAAAGEDGDMDHEPVTLNKRVPVLRGEDRNSRRGLQRLVCGDTAFGHEKFYYTSLARP